MIPLTFVSVMAVGGIIGASEVFVPGSEMMILLSVIVFSGLVLTRAHFRIGASIAVVALFAFFHGFAHGQEVPNAASLSSFGLGFLLATALLHVMGYSAARLAMALATLCASNAAFAQDSGTSRLQEITVFGRQDSLVGIADSATQGTVGAEQLARRPTSRAGEVLETVPGVIITQHAGGGKANQYFLRGFNIDHGTDFATDLGGMPVNLPSHGHGQGYSDMNIVIPELVERVNY